MKIEFLYRCGANYKTFFCRRVLLKDYPEARNLVKGGEVIMGEFGTLTQQEFFLSEVHPHAYDERYDHDILEITEIL